MDNLDPQLAQELKEIANKEDALLMTFIAPETPVKTSPVDYDYASITVQDTYNIEETIEELRAANKLPPKLHLIVHTPGGSVYATTKIAKYMRSLFDTIEAYVPYEAASGGTMLCLAANSIVMDRLSNLTPIDPQTVYNGQYVSAASFEQAVKELQDKFGNLRPAQIPSPYQQLSSKLDPIILKEMNKTVVDTVMVAWELLKKAQIQPSQEVNVEQELKLLTVASSLARTPWPHSHIVDIEEARNIGLPVSSDLEKLKLLKTYKKWVSKRLKEPQANHIIEYVMPQASETGINKTNEVG